MLVNGKMYQKIPVFFSCLLKAFLLSNSMPPKNIKTKKHSLHISNENNNIDTKKSRNTFTNVMSNEKAKLFQRLHRLFNLNKITKNIVKMLMMSNSASQLKKEISKVHNIIIKR